MKENKRSHWHQLVLVIWIISLALNSAKGQESDLSEESRLRFSNAQLVSIPPVRSPVGNPA